MQSIEEPQCWYYWTRVLHSTLLMTPVPGKLDLPLRYSIGLVEGQGLFLCQKVTLNQRRVKSQGSILGPLIIQYLYAHPKSDINREHNISYHNDRCLFLVPGCYKPIQALDECIKEISAKMFLKLLQTFLPTIDS